MSRDLQALPPDVTLVLHHSGDDVPPWALPNLQTALAKARVAYRLHDLAHDPALPALDGVTAVLCLTNDLSAPAAALPRIGRYLSGGGGWAQLYPARHPAFDEVLGIVPPERFAAAVAAGHQGGGLHFPGMALPSFQGLSLPERQTISHQGLGLQPVYEAQIIATTIGGKPLAWRHAVGQGCTVYWDSIALTEQRCAGLIIETLQCICAVSVLPVANAGVVQIDDFPAPLGGTLPDVVQAAYPGMDADQFYSQVWYPDLKRLGRRHGLDYSCYVTFSYALPGASDHILAHEAASQTFAAIRQHGAAELGLHGFDHRYLKLGPFDGEPAMRAALARAREAWGRAGLGAMPNSYVPPGNEYDATGLAALGAVFPEITTLCGVFNGRRDKPEQNRDFGPEPWRPALLAMPRVTAGHECRDEVQFDAMSQIASLGLWTHFLHADDVADIPGRGVAGYDKRNPAARPWRTRGGQTGLLDQLGQIFTTVRRRAPWLQFTSTSGAAPRLQRHLESRWHVGRDGPHLTIAGPRGGVLRLRLNGRPWRHLATREGVRLLDESSAEDYTLYCLELTGDRATLTLSEHGPMGRVSRRLRDRIGQASGARNRPSPASVTRAAKPS
ncbi:DUF2194 domain-containing protein [Pseudooceanicola nanhaiensis]|uniref:DUF2194 domain-containing protein n=1 Tax=Pseudooceanicola nanhaiensis TaxID=375761 RepID=UPI001CD203CA|nr:DUF2194 domain-containing protein [Pseudooceanicola nanhaiensis]MCA0918756.1 DUF2194 domain-containing protein [Pseudooceanicola nanhaiensis]